MSSQYQVSNMATLPCNGTTLLRSLLVLYRYVYTSSDKLLLPQANCILFWMASVGNPLAQLLKSDQIKIITDEVYKLEWFTYEFMDCLDLVLPQLACSGQSFLVCV